MDEEQQEETEESEKQKFAALAFLEGCNCTKFGKVMAELNNDFVKGVSNYPETVEDGLQMITDWTNYDGTASQKKFKPKRGAAFAQKKKLVCYNCGEEGHIKPNCPKRGEETRESSHVSSGSSEQQQQQQQTAEDSQQEEEAFSVLQISRGGQERGVSFLCIKKKENTSFAGHEKFRRADRIVIATIAQRTNF